MKNKLVKTLLCCSLLGGVGIVGAAVENNNLQAVRAEDTLVQIGVGDFKASDGTFVELPEEVPLLRFAVHELSHGLALVPED